jgi:hypothetical protein
MTVTASVPFPSVPAFDVEAMGSRRRGGNRRLTTSVVLLSGKSILLGYSPASLGWRTGTQLPVDAASIDS